MNKEYGVFKNKNPNLRLRKGRVEDKKDFPTGNAVSLKLFYNFYESILKFLLAFFHVY